MGAQQAGEDDEPAEKDEAAENKQQHEEKEEGIEMDQGFDGELHDGELEKEDEDDNDQVCAAAPISGTTVGNVVWWRPVCKDVV
jgi:hypothetical protein